MRQRVADIRQRFKELYQEKEFVTDKTGVKTIEIVNASFEADEETIFSPINYEYVEKELSWYIKQSLNVHDMGEPVPKIWRDVADKFGNINSNYGWCIWSPSNFYQYESVLSELKKNINSRRAIMIYTRPSMQLEYSLCGKSDFICTNTVQYLIRKDKLISCVNMRSNDAWAGYRNDYAWHKYVALKLGTDLGVEPGTVFWTSGSLHLYDRQFYLIEHFIKTGEFNISKEEYSRLYG